MPGIGHTTRVLGWDMLERLCVQNATTRGICISPLSITTALAMLAGAVGVDRRAQFCQAIGVNNLSELSDAFQVLDTVFGNKNQNQMVTMANAAFADSDVEFRSAYIRFLDSLGVHTIKFSSLEESAEEINGWVSVNTRGLISDLVSRDVLKGAHVALINALAFRGTWKTKFDRTLTQRNTPFYSTESKERKVDMMFSYKKNIAMAKRPGYTAVRLPYAAAVPSASMALVAYLPDRGISLEQLVQTMDRAQRTLTFRAKKYDKFGFPKLNLDTSLSILPMLQNLGFPVSGQFPEMVEGGNEVQACIHRATIKLDEEGTEAAAATAIIMTRSLVPNPEILVFDRPFAFSICLEETGIAVFTGLFFG
ncbi:hypothetical protein AK830_g6079 [Neonectria ditissima]|uniref:Serpin domain-containing protein n=1 Tax=Neonectria ditissima TaxID=78410 RepID=A0A0P7ARS1_9HYPO|nr:hypothetical protein AK830_g6079 [Neonectria ditissima]